MNIDDNALIDALAAEQLGGQPTQQAQAPAQPPAPAKETTNEKVQQNVAPTTEGSASQKQPFEFFEVVDENGNKSVYSPEQLKGITSRYKDLNYKHQNEIAPIKKSVGLLNTLREQARLAGEELDDDSLAQLLEASITAYAHSPEIGGQQTKPAQQQPGRQNIAVQTQTGQTNGQNIEQTLADWEQQNAVTLPPMYKEAMMKSGSLEQEITQLKEMMTQLMQNGAQTTQVAQEQVTQAQSANAEAGKQQIINNLQRVQNKFQLPDEAETDFITFVQERGYDTWDLMDYQLTEQLAQDFKNNAAGPELERLRSIQQRRQAFTGNLSPSPSSAGGELPKPDENAEFIDTMTDDIMKKRNML